MLQTTDGVPAAKLSWEAKGRRLIGLLCGFALLVGGSAPFHSNGFWH
jgi:hypothetical protein